MINVQSPLRFRNIYIFLGGTLVTILYMLIDPRAELITNLPFGSRAVRSLSVLLTGIWFVGLLHVSRKALLDYMDLKALLEMAEKTPEGASRAIIGVGLIMISISIVILAAVLAAVLHT